MNLVNREYQGMSFVFREDGYFNMTKAAHAYGKLLDNFWTTKGTFEYLETLGVALGKLPEIQGVWRDELSLDEIGVRIKSIRNCCSERTVGRSGGTWAHPKLAVYFARWLDPKFAVFCDMVIDDILRNKAKLTLTKPKESAVMALPQSYLESLQELVKAVAAQEELKAQNATLANQNAMLLPAAEVGSAIAKRTALGVVDFCRKLPGVSTNAVQTRLYDMQYLHKRNGHWAPYSKFKGVLFDETFTSEGYSKVVVLEAGQRKLVDMYHAGLLPMLKGRTPDKHLEVSL
jgi:hypothetical protein